MSRKYNNELFAFVNGTSEALAPAERKTTEGR